MIMFFIFCASVLILFVLFLKTIVFIPENPLNVNRKIKPKWGICVSVGKSIKNRVDDVRNHDIGRITPI